MADTRLQLIFAAKDLSEAALGHVRSGLKDVGDAAKGTGGHLAGAANKVVDLGKFAAVAAGGGLALLTGVVLDGAKALAEQQKIDAQTGAVLKSTGDAAHVTADHVGDLANAIKDYSGIDDDAVKQGENLLLTFTNIRNEAGKGNDIFDQSTKTLADMSAALGTDMSSSAIQLGKALNDPVKGITALTRVGVTFTDQQKAQIAAMVKAGDTAGAQKVILGELNREFGGSAKAVGDTAAGAWNKFQNAIGDLGKDLASTFMPAITSVLTFITSTVIPVIGTTLGPILSSVGDIAGRIGSALGGLVGVFSGVSGAASSAGGILKSGFGDYLGVLNGTVIPAVGGALSWITTTILPPLQTIFQAFAENILPILSDAFGTVASIVRDNWPTISSIAETVGGALKTAFEAIAAVVKAVFPILREVAKVLFPAIATAAGVLLHGIDFAFKAIGAIWNAGWAVAKGVAAGIGGAFSNLVGVFNTVGNAISGVFKTAMNFLIGIVNAIIGAVDSIQVHIGKIGLDTPAGFIGVGPFDWNGLQIPKLKYLAEGGIVLHPTLAAIAENDRPEAVIPLDKLPDIVGRGGGDNVIEVHTHLVLDGREIAESVDRHRYRTDALASTSTRAF
jgi:hypothetical protein